MEENLRRSLLLSNGSTANFSFKSVLGGLMEENLRRSLLLSNGSWEFLWDRTLTLCILLTTENIVKNYIIKLCIVFCSHLIVIWHIHTKHLKKINLKLHL